MALRKINEDLRKTDYIHLKNTYNDSAVRNPSHDANLPTNFEIKTITLEDIDQAVWIEFNKRFVIRDKQLPLISGDAEVTSMNYQNYEQFDLEKGFINGPLLVFTRTSTEKRWRTNPAKKYILYSVPKKKAQGVVFEEYIAPGPINYELIYEFKFISDFREATNQLEEQLNGYFKNKRNIIPLNNERFSIGPVDQNKLTDVQTLNKEQSEQRTMYVTTFRLKLWCYTFDASLVQKRERPNSYTLTMVVKNDKNEVIDEARNPERVIPLDDVNPQYFKHPEDETK